MVGIPSSEPPKVLYHYCSTESFYGIITSKNIRLSNCLYSNDPNENRISKNLLISISQNSDDENIRNFAIKALEYKFEIFDDFGSYIFCLSEKSDDLNQWRIYGDNGFGYMVGLRTEYFLDNKYWSLLDDNVVFPFIDKIYLCKCIYDCKIQRNIIEMWIKSFLMESTISEEQRILNFKNVLQFYSAIFKHDSYSEEKEWRLICFPITQPQSPNISVKYKSYFIAKKGLISQFIQMDYMDKSEFGNWPFEIIYLGSNVLNSDMEIMDFTRFHRCHYVHVIKKSELKMRLK
jgi:hypothetical protein